MPYIVQYIKRMNGERAHMAEIIDDNAAVNCKMKAFLELEEMLVPLSQELDCEKELAKAREEKYGYLD